MYVRYVVNGSGVVIEKFIPSYYKAKNFINKLENSKKCTLLSYRKP